MAIQLSDLSPKYQQQVIDQYKKQGKEVPQDWNNPPKSDLLTKYHNRPTERETPAESIKFQSRKEARRYDELMLMLKAGVIRRLKLQPQFTLQESFITSEGKRVQAVRYTADFSYEKKLQDTATETWSLVVEDVKVKATQTPQYRTKKKMMIEKYGIEIAEV